jgi:hypothetical protein
MFAFGSRPTGQSRHRNRGWPRQSPQQLAGFTTRRDAFAEDPLLLDITLFPYGDLQHRSPVSSSVSATEQASARHKSFAELMIMRAVPDSFSVEVSCVLM